MKELSRLYQIYFYEKRKLDSMSALFVFVDIDPNMTSVYVYQKNKIDKLEEKINNLFFKLLKQDEDRYFSILKEIAFSN